MKRPTGRDQIYQLARLHWQSVHRSAGRGEREQATFVGHLHPDKGEVNLEGTPHNALEDAKLAAECFTRLMDGKNLFPEYSQFKVPGELRK